MQDRVSQYPGRVKLTPVSGQENVYDMEWADNPSVVGTPLNKNSLLKDATAALFGLGSDALPDEVLALAAGLISGKAEQSVVDALTETVNTKGRISVGRYSGNVSSEESGSQTINVGFSIKGVHIEVSSGTRSGSGIWGGLAIRGGNLSTAASVSGSTFTVNQGPQAPINLAGRTYYYVAFG